ncbi:MAG: diacylglycerol kinase family lipid kinase [Saprospiraceae bacterium]|jgi:YegS/Rv2252/BmrU family lipid kinase|nr:diacylglycerol kinase family lipid kinase [Saprospiraceae bacterium]
MLRKKIRFVLNPFSGPKKKVDIKSILQNRINTEIIDTEICYTSYPGHATELSREAVDLGYYAVVAIGGDGTINEVAKSLVHTETALGIIPFGSGNGFSYHVGTKRDIFKAISCINNLNKICIDTILMNNNFFLNVAGIGLDAKVAFMTKKNKKRGFLPYFFQTLKESKGFRYMNLHIKTPSVSWENEYAMATIANASMYGYNFSIAPRAKINDGQFDVVLVKKAPVFKYFSLALRMLFKSLDKSPLVTYFTGSEMQISTKDATYYHLDGEGYKSTQNEFVFKVDPQSLYLLV